GSYTVWVKQVDAAGNVSAPVTQTITIARYGDLADPSLTLQDAEQFNAGTVSVTGTVTDASPLTVTYALSGQAVDTGDISVNGDGSFKVDLSNLAEGSYTLTVTAKDNNGNSSKKSTSFSTDRTAPEASPSADQSDTEWRNTPFVAHFTASDALSGLNSAADADFDLTVTADAPNATDLVTVTRDIKDTVGNTRTVSASARIDTVAPTIVAQADRAPEWNGWYGDDVTVSFTSNDALSGVATPAAAQTVTKSGVVTGTVKDRAGNSATSAPLTLQIDKDGPAFGTDVDGSWLANADGTGYDAHLTGTLSDATQISSLTASVNGATATSVTITAGASVSLNFDVLGLLEGSNTILLTATDVFGHSSQQTVTVTVPDQTLPEFNSVNYELVVGGVRVYGSAMDSGRVTRVTYQLNSGAETDLTVTPGNTVAFDQTVGGVVTGLNTLTVRAYDAAGNSAEQVKTFNVASPDYLAPSISNFGAVYRGASRNISVTATVVDLAPVGATAGIKTVELKYIGANGVTKTTDITRSLSGSALSYKLTSVPVGTVLTLVVTDKSGNVATATTKIVAR
ncbi:Ig-like domain-containing protein, partial [Deinococcus navajonensis]